jgi:predicted alpha/beta hydrolase
MIPDAIDEASSLWPNRPVFLCGHSLGGQLATVASASAHRLAGIVLIAAGTAHWRRWPQGHRLRAAVMVHAISALAGLLPFYPGHKLGFGGRQSRRFMRDWSFNALTGRYRLEGSARVPLAVQAGLRGMRLPVLALSIEGDAVAPTGALLELLSHVPAAQLQRFVLAGVTGHSPWKRHFSWARHAIGVESCISRWLTAQANGTQPAFHPSHPEPDHVPA